MYKYFVGVDEAGRGPLAGPVAVGVALVPETFDWQLLAGVNDSKQLTEKNREAIFLRTKQLKKEGELNFAVAMISAHVIDTIGIVPAINRAMYRALTKVMQNSTIYRSKESFCIDEVLVKLDGGLVAPREYVHQETIVKGDAKEKVIGLASIMAKVTRDRHMVRIAAKPQFAPYAFAAHKGYGTKAHCAALRDHGVSSVHRKTFCRRFL